MRINKLILENFEFMQVAMNSTRIEIDFSEMQNRICLLIGPNGSGKTSIMSLLTPFASIGNLDVRDGSGLIISGSHGYKEIHIIKDGDTYIIKHFYTPSKKSHTVKSYIEKNGEELNVNGNVTSFKEIVRDELHVELEYLKLIRIGSNVTSMINLSETERKNFLSKLLEEIGVFLSLHKKVSGDYKQINDLINLTQNKMERLEIVSEEEELSRIRLFEEKLDDERRKSEESLREKSIAEHEVSQIENPDTLKSRINDLTKKERKMSRIIDSKDTLESTDPEFYRNKIQDIEKEISVASTMISSYEITLRNLIDDQDALEIERRELNVSLQKELSNDEELTKMEKEADHMRDQIRVIERIIRGIEINITEKELSTFIVFLKNINQVVTTTYSFGKRPVRMIVKLLREGKSVSSYIQAHAFVGYDEDAVTIIYDRINQIMPDIKEYQSKEESCKDCKLKSFYSSIYNMIHVDKEKDSKLTSEEIKYMELAWSNIQRVLVSFGSYSDIIKRLPNEYQDDFKTDKILSCIYNQESIFDESKYNDLLSIVTEYSNLEDLRRSLEKMNADIHRFSSFSQLSSVREKLDRLNEKSIHLNKKRKDTKSELELQSERLHDLKRTLESLYEYYETFSSYHEIKENIRVLSDQFDSFEKNHEIIRSSTIMISQCKVTIDSYTEKIQTIKSKLSMYKQYKKDLKKYRGIYEDLSVLRRALSSKEGISLKYMLRYIGNTEEITNELLDIAYNGNIYVDKFNITKDSFTIPFFNKGKRISDVKYASQGELSFLSIALSFALASQTLKKYNIMLLDEIDGPLDTSNREKFIKILENQIERISCEQCFLITHNEMFSSYPVDIIDLSFGDYAVEKYPNAHIIPIRRD